MYTLHPKGRCTGTTKKGVQCSRTVRTGNKCYQHKGGTFWDLFTYNRRRSRTTLVSRLTPPAGEDHTFYSGCVMLCDIPYAMFPRHDFFGTFHNNELCKKGDRIDDIMISHCNDRLMGFNNGRQVMDIPFYVKEERYVGPSYTKKYMDVWYDSIP